MKKTPIELRFWGKVNKDGECWEWIGSKNQDGYGLIQKGGMAHRAHRIAWELSHGAIPNGMFILHRCDNPSCVNPDHLFLGTNADNMRDAGRKGRHGMQVTPGLASRVRRSALLTALPTGDAHDAEGGESE